MRCSVTAARLCASALLACAGSGVAAAPADDALNEIKQQIEALKQQQGKYTVSPGSLAIESWLLTSTAIDSTATKIHDAVGDKVSPEAKLLVVGGVEALEFSQAAMLATEIEALRDRLAKVCRCGPLRAQAVPGLAVAGAVIGLLKSDVQIDPIEQSVDAKLLAAAVASKFKNAILPTAAVAPDGEGELFESFNQLVETADAAQRAYEALSALPSLNPVQKETQAKLKALLDRYETFYARVTTATDKGVVPLAVAAGLQKIIDGNPYVLRVNTEKAGGTLLKRTNVLTALGAESAFISGGLVSSYQLTEPTTGKLLRAGVVTCRTTLTSLKRVQNASWRSSEHRTVDNSRTEPIAVCSP